MTRYEYKVFDPGKVDKNGFPAELTRDTAVLMSAVLTMLGHAGWHFVAVLPATSSHIAPGLLFEREVERCPCCPHGVHDHRCGIWIGKHPNDTASCECEGPKE